MVYVEVSIWGDMVESVTCDFIRSGFCDSFVCFSCDDVIDSAIKEFIAK